MGSEMCIRDSCRWKGFPYSNISIYLFDELFEVGFHHDKYLDRGHIAVAPALGRDNALRPAHQSSMIPVDSQAIMRDRRGTYVPCPRWGTRWRLGCSGLKLIHPVVRRLFVLVPTTLCSCSHNNTIEQQPGWRTYSGAALRARPVGAGACPWHPPSAGLCIAERRCCYHGVWVER